MSGRCSAASGRRRAATGSSHQVGVELIGPGEPLADAEVIALGRDILRGLGIEGQAVLELNTLGDAESRQAWRAALVGYFSELRGRLSEESQARLERNPLRILDSKSPQDQALVAGAPTIEASLTPSARGHWDAVRSALDGFGVPFRENPRIVRGLDYYSHTAFEFVTDRLGAQGTVLAGGRYDGLVAEMGGPPTPAVGWAAGIERLSMLLDEVPEAPRPVAVVPVGEAVLPDATRVLQSLRDAGVRAEMAYRGNVRRRMERANRIGARFAVILGDEEVARGVAQLKALGDGGQAEVALAALPAHLRALLG